MVRIGLISDTHIPEAGKELPREVFDALNGVDVVLHAGDMHVIQVLDWLESLGQVWGARGNGDDPELNGGATAMRPGVPEDPRVKEAQVVELGGLKIGLVHDFPLPGEVPWLPIEAFLDRYFHGAVDIVVCGHTHVAKITNYNDMLIVNPGSPTLPSNYLKLGNVGILDIQDGKVDAQIIQLGSD